MRNICIVQRSNQWAELVSLKQGHEPLQLLECRGRPMICTHLSAGFLRREDRRPERAAGLHYHQGNSWSHLPQAGREADKPFPSDVAPWLRREIPLAPVQVCSLPTPTPFHCKVSFAFANSADKRSPIRPQDIQSQPTPSPRQEGKPQKS